MTDFHTLPVDEAITWIRAWTDHTWPITLEEAFAIRDRLGWRPSSKGDSFFITRLSKDGKEDGYIGDVEQGGVKRVYFSLSSLTPLSEGEVNASESRASYKQYKAALTTMWGPGEPLDDEKISESRWVLPNEVSVSIVGDGGLIAVTIESPYMTQLDEDLEYYEEKGYGQEGLLD